MIWPPCKPDLNPQHERPFEAAGIEKVRYLLAINRGGAHLYITGGPPSSEAQEWVRWKAERDAFWIRAGIVAAISAALLTLVSCLLTVLAWKFPVTPGK